MDSLILQDHLEELAEKGDPSHHDRERLSTDRERLSKTGRHLACAWVRCAVCQPPAIKRRRGIGGGEGRRMVPSSVSSTSASR